jgi:hypothetical protein
MISKRKPPRRRPKSVPKIRLRKGSAINVTRDEFESVITLLNEHREVINEVHGELHATCRDLASQVEKNRLALEVQFTRIVQLQQEIDVLKRRLGAPLGK